MFVLWCKIEFDNQVIITINYKIIYRWDGMTLRQSIPPDQLPVQP